MKNEIHGVLLDNGIRDRVLGDRLVDHPAEAEEILKKVELSAASASCIRTSLTLLTHLRQFRVVEFEKTAILQGILRSESGKLRFCSAKI